MPLHIYFAVFVLTLTPPMTGVAIIIFGVEYPPYTRSTLALGTVVLMLATVLASLGSASAILDGRQPFFPYLLLTGLPALTVARMMHLELNKSP
jgi:hypothetical protein